MAKENSSREAKKPQPRVVQDAESPYNEAQQSPAGSGDPRTDNAVPAAPDLAWGQPSDDRHPVTQPEGDAGDKQSRPVGEPGKPKRAA